MEKLELKHLSPYLPFKLRMMYGERNCMLNIGAGSSKNWIGINAAISRQWNEEFPIKPILRPLSDLTKEIETQGKFSTSYLDKLKTNEDSGCYIDYTAITELDCVKEYSYETLVKLFEWHFDVFGLIEKGLAIDINTLPN